MGTWMYTSTFSWPRHYLEVRVQFHDTSALSPGKELVVSIGKECWEVQVAVWTSRRRKYCWSFRDRNSESSVVQPAASHCTYWAIPAPIQWVRRILSLGTKWPGLNQITHFRLELRSRKVELHLYSPIYLHGIILNYLSTETTLPSFLVVPVLFVKKIVSIWTERHPRRCTLNGLRMESGLELSA
jgi:hypothetical protein